MSNSSGISACVMSSEYFTRTSLYLVRLKVFEWIKFLRIHLHQIQGNGAGRNFITASHHFERPPHKSFLCICEKSITFPAMASNFFFTRFWKSRFWSSNVKVATCKSSVEGAGRRTEFARGAAERSVHSLYTLLPKVKSKKYAYGLFRRFPTGFWDRGFSL